MACCSEQLCLININVSLRLSGFGFDWFWKHRLARILHPRLLQLLCIHTPFQLVPFHPWSLVSVRKLMREFHVFLVWKKRPVCDDFEWLASCGRPSLPWQDLCSLCSTCQCVDLCVPHCSLWLGAPPSFPWWIPFNFDEVFITVFYLWSSRFARLVLNKDNFGLNSRNWYGRYKEMHWISKLNNLFPCKLDWFMDNNTLWFLKFINSDLLIWQLVFLGGLFARFSAILPKGFLAFVGCFVSSGSDVPFLFSAITLNMYSSPSFSFGTRHSVWSGGIVPGTFSQRPFFGFIFSTT